MSEAAKFPITLEHVMFVRTSVVSVPDYAPSQDAAIKPENNISVSSLEEDPNRFRAGMRTQVNLAMDKMFPYSVDVECIATLISDGTLSKEEAHRAVTITAHNVLYGAIRETVAWITGRHPYGPLVLALSVLQSRKGVDAEGEKKK